jgi:hypothetical protein
MHINQIEFRGKDHRQQDGPCTLDLRNETTLHEALKMMIVDHETLRPYSSLSSQEELSEHCSFPLDLSQGYILQRAKQIMNDEFER